MMNKSDRLGRQVRQLAQCPEWADEQELQAGRPLTEEELEMIAEQQLRED